MCYYKECQQYMHHSAQPTGMTCRIVQDMCGISKGYISMGYQRDISHTNNHVKGINIPSWTSIISIRVGYPSARGWGYRKGCILREGTKGVRGYASVCTMHHEIFSEKFPACQPLDKTKAPAGNNLWDSDLDLYALRTSIRELPLGKRSPPSARAEGTSGHLRSL